MKRIALAWATLAIVAACARQSKENPPGAGPVGQVGGIQLVGDTGRGAGEKVLVATYRFDSTGVRPGEAIVAYGSGRLPRSEGGAYRLQLVDAQGTALAEYSIGDPRRVVVEHQGVVQNSQGIYAARFPFHPRAREIRVLDQGGAILARTDVAAVIREFCDRLPQDKDCVEARRSR
jgi:hypothetical protein